MTVRRIAALVLLLAIAACSPPRVVGDGCEWVPQPPRPELCEPGENPDVDENLIAECTAFTKPMGDWFLGLNDLGRENCEWGD